MKITRFVAWILAGVFLLATFRLYPQEAKTIHVNKPYEMSEIQKLRLQVKQKDAQLAQQASAIAQNNFQRTINDFNAEVRAIEKENNWPETLQLNPDTLEFKEPPEASKKP